VNDLKTAQGMPWVYYRWDQMRDRMDHWIAGSRTSAALVVPVRVPFRRPAPGNPASRGGGGPSHARTPYRANEHMISISMPK
jgi:hypothetical protein